MTAAYSKGRRNQKLVRKRLEIWKTGKEVTKQQSGKMEVVKGSIRK
jgi:hypothetical protein